MYKKLLLRLIKILSVLKRHLKNKYNKILDKEKSIRNLEIEAAQKLINFNTKRIKDIEKIILQ